MLCGISLVIGGLALAGGAAGAVAHYSRGHIGFGEAEASHKLGAWRLDGFAQRYLFRADVDAAGGWDVMSRRNLASMVTAGALGPLVMGALLITFVAH